MADRSDPIGTQARQSTVRDPEPAGIGRRRRVGALGVTLAVVALAGAGCGGAQPSQTRPRLTLDGAERVAPSDLPPARGRTLEQIAGAAGRTADVGLASSVLVPGRQRVGFNLIGATGALVWGKTGVYVAAAPGRPAVGPYLAPADSMVAAKAFRARGALDPSQPPAVYSARVLFPRPGSYALLAVARLPGGDLSAGGTRVRVRARDPIPGPGDRAPRVATDTIASARGDIRAIDTREPPDDMHRVDLKEVAGKRPVALLFSTPKLCQSRVCGPVTDVLAQLERTYRGRMAFIHEEVYAGNDPKKGLRPPLEAFSLRSEPWLFTLDRRGRVAARLEGAFGFRDVRGAIEAALR